MINPVLFVQVALFALLCIEQCISFVFQGYSSLAHLFMGNYSFICLVGHVLMVGDLNSLTLRDETLLR